MRCLGKVFLSHIGARKRGSIELTDRRTGLRLRLSTLGWEVWIVSGRARVACPRAPGGCYACNAPWAPGDEANGDERPRTVRAEAWRAGVCSSQGELGPSPQRRRRALALQRRTRRSHTTASQLSGIANLAVKPRGVELRAIDRAEIDDAPLQPVEPAAAAAAAGLASAQVRVLPWCLEALSFCSSFRVRPPAALARRVRSLEQALRHHPQASRIRAQQRSWQALTQPYPDLAAPASASRSLQVDQQHLQTPTSTAAACEPPLEQQLLQLALGPPPRPKRAKGQQPQPQQPPVAGTLPQPPQGQEAPPLPPSDEHHPTPTGQAPGEQDRPAQPRGAAAAGAATEQREGEPPPPLSVGPDQGLRLHAFAWALPRRPLLTAVCQSLSAWVLTGRFPFPMVRRHPPQPQAQGSGLRARHAMAAVATTQAWGKGRGQ